MNESQAVQRIHAYLTHDLGFPTELIQREYQTSRNARLDLVVILHGRIQIVCEAKRLDKLPPDTNLIPFNALIRQIQFAAIEVGARFFLVSDGLQMLWFETDESGRPLPLSVPKTYYDLVEGDSYSQSRASRIAGVRSTLRNMLERSRQQKWSPEALALILFAHLQWRRGRNIFCDLLIGGSNSQVELAAARLEWSDADFVEMFVLAARHNPTSPRVYQEALDLLAASALDSLEPVDALSLLDDILGRYPTLSGAIRLPRWTSDLLVRLAGLEQGDRVLDLHCGLGNLSAAVRLAGTTSPSNMVLFARHATDAIWASVQQLVFGAELPSISIGDPLESTQSAHRQDGLADLIFVAPPFGMTTRHKRFDDRRSGGLSSEEAYLHHALEHLSPTGRIVALLPNGPLGNPDRSHLRKLLLDNGLQAVIDIGTFLPDSGLAASIIVLDKSAHSRDALFFAKVQSRQQQDSFDCTSLAGLPHVLQRFGSWMKGHEIGNDNLGLTATAPPEEGVLSAGPYLARQAQQQLPLTSFKHHSLETLALITKGGAIRRSKNAGDVVFIGPGAIRPLEIQLDPQDRADEAEVQQYPNAVASEGDIVLNGLSTYLGAAALVESGRFPINRHVFRIRVHNTLVLPEFLAIAINSRYVHEILIAGAGGSVMKMLRLEVLQKILIPVPPRDIQAEIVRRVVLAKEERNVVERSLQQKEKALSVLVRDLDLGETA
ncbi:N-6 DNA methylase [Pseudomonas gingeri]|uniref:N-6 DNA methylase n=1 Tax=Pseudomonas gingeri TaxID=117681 RepID=UPI0015A3A7F0|nr:N-6 DNA methylase [Pseudomonas gingeri]NWA28573.1 N-6 DNA methylase [Pseudomonas gingeri]